LAVELVDLHCFVEVARLADSQYFVEEARSVGFAAVVELPYLEWLSRTGLSNHCKRCMRGYSTKHPLHAWAKYADHHLLEHV
jgi:hypothetical protein